MPSRTGIPVAIAAVAGLVFTLAFYPGWLSFDSSYQWWQARTGEISTINGIGIVLLWRAARLLHDGPAPLLILQMLLFWSGAAWLAIGTAATTTGRVVLLALLAGAPASWLLAQIWSDTALAALLVFASAAILHHRTHGGRGAFGVALTALLLAASQRHNAIFAVAPLLLWLFAADAAATRAQRWMRSIAAAATGLVLVGGVQLTAAMMTRHHFPVLPSLTLWDLAGMSVHERRMLLPDYAVAPNVTVDDLASAYVSWSNTPLFASPRAGVRYPFQPWPAHDQRRLREDWLATIASHPQAYLAHRGALLADLFGTRARALPAELTYVPGPVHYGDNPAVAAGDGALRRIALAAFDALRATPAFAAWPYLAIGLIAAMAALRRGNDRRPAVLWLWASAAAYALPYTLLAPAAEFRYLLWSCLACLIAAWLQFVPRAKRED